MNAEHAFDSKREGGARCSCGHPRSEHVERFERDKPLRNVCRSCAAR